MRELADLQKRCGGMAPLQEEAGQLLSLKKGVEDELNLSDERVRTLNEELKALAEV